MKWLSVVVCNEIYVIDIVNVKCGRCKVFGINQELWCLITDRTSIRGKRIQSSLSSLRISLVWFVLEVTPLLEILAVP